MERYRDFDIRPTDPLPPIPTCRHFAWSYVHKDYDGAEDSGDHRCGYAPSAAACKSEIDELLEPLKRWWPDAIEVLPGDST